MKQPLRFLRRWVLVVLGSVLVQGAFGQILEVTATIPAPEAGPLYVMPLRCDSHGDIFIRRPPLTQGTPKSESHSESQPFIAKISSDGRRVAAFDLSAAATDGNPGLLLKTYAVNSDGTLIVLATSKGKNPTLVKFDTDGHYSGSITLDVNFEPQQMAAFSDGTFLAAGVVLSKPSPKAEFAPYLAIFDRSGRLANAIDAPATDPTQSLVPSRPGTLSLDMATSDGSNVYLVRQGSSPIVVVISQAGVIDRTLKLSYPYPEAHITGMWVADFNLLVQYTRPNATPNGRSAFDLVLYNSQTGEQITSYAKSADPDLAGSLACTDFKGGLRSCLQISRERRCW